MGDAKDILGISRATSVSGHPPPPRAKGNSFVNKKPDGVSREVKWEWSPFTMGARTDNLKLHHWVKAAEAGALPAEYSFDKYNKAVDMVHYTGDEYSTLLHDPRWSQEETDHLFELCARFDLRFIVIADRFGVGGEWPERSVEDLKERYYSAEAERSAARAAAPGASSDPDHLPGEAPAALLQEQKQISPLAAGIPHVWSVSREAARGAGEANPDLSTSVLASSRFPMTDR
eukprot:jgi/Mesen1/9368/ME000610S08694